MRIFSNNPCIVVLTEKDVWLRVNGKEAINLKANHMALIACENNIIDISSINNALVAHISRDIIKDYLRFLNKDLSNIPLWQRSSSPVLTAECVTPMSSGWQHNTALRIPTALAKKNVQAACCSPCYPAFSTVRSFCPC